MKRLIAVGLLVGACVSTMAASPALAQARAVAVKQCLFSGPIGAMTGGANGDPVRYDIDTDGRAVLIVHKVQTNFDFSNPFKPRVFAEEPTCRLKLDCTIAKQGLKDIGVQSTGASQAANPTSGSGSGFPSCSPTTTQRATRPAISWRSIRCERPTPSSAASDKPWRRRRPSASRARCRSGDRS